MRCKKTIIISVTGFLALLVVFIYLTPFAGNIVANTRFEGYASSVGIRKIKEFPPLPSVTSGKTQIRVIQSSYCWGNLGCADYVRGNAMLKEIIPTPVNPEEDIKVSFANIPAPSGLDIHQFVDKKSMKIPMKYGSFSAPKEKGVYYYGIFAFWTTDDGKFSKGDTSSVFAIEVR
ncbi:hypothetical protein GQF01_00435 [Paenibacillus sp. 5J-6]|uniref:Uncharacterized protein n=1 Tax=Paenibacillus silvestris TaxID=2606219 RepID=A0A6L8UTB7_9BACL|nr:hypothetical protein [Paenibacillus silvestris]MZQ80622.1 hypothetical protein [Paenibacillus silvestris]